MAHQPTPPNRPPRNKGLIAGLLKGNQWVFRAALIIRDPGWGNTWGTLGVGRLMSQRSIQATHVTISLRSCPSIRSHDFPPPLVARLHGHDDDWVAFGSRLGDQEKNHMVGGRSPSLQVFKKQFMYFLIRKLELWFSRRFWDTHRNYIIIKQNKAFSYEISRNFQYFPVLSPLHPGIFVTWKCSESDQLPVRVNEEIKHPSKYDVYNHVLIIYTCRYMYIYTILYVYIIL